jgi:hypothetical protein
MPKNNASDPITDQEIAFARLVLCGTMTDRRAAEAVGLHPDSAAYTKAKPRVRAYMHEHRDAVQQQLVEQATDLSRLAVGRAVDEQHRLHPNRDQVLDRLWELANLSPETTRGSITGQVKALSMIIAIEGLIPDRRAADRLSVSSERNSAPAPTHPQPSANPAQREDEPAVPEPKLAHTTVADPPPYHGPSQPILANCFSPSQAPGPYVPLFGSVSDLGVPFPIIKNPFVHPR